jgi:PilZ domain
MADDATAGGGADKRREHRMRVLKSARIIFNGGYAVFDCRVKNVSDGGALLQMPSSLGIPSRFEVDIDHANKPRPCTVKWRNDKMLGVAFDDAAPAAAPAPADGAPLLRLVDNPDPETDGNPLTLVPALKSA